MRRPLPKHPCSSGETEGQEKGMLKVSEGPGLTAGPGVLPCPLALKGKSSPGSSWLALPIRAAQRRRPLAT